MLRSYQAANELERIKNLPAFNLPNAQRQKINQHSTLYTFEDGSRLFIKHTLQRADCWHPGWRGRADDIHLGPVKGVAIRVNRTGA